VKIIAGSALIREAILQTEFEIVGLSTKLTYHNQATELHDDLRGAKARLETLRSLLWIAEK